MDKILTRQQLEDAARCEKRICDGCLVLDGCAGYCAQAAAQTALVLADMLKRLEWGAIAQWGNDRRCMICQSLKSEGHKQDCELAALLHGLEG